MTNLKTALLAIAIVAGFAALPHASRAETRTATVAGGCFWCVEADFESLRGVSEVISGYTGGHVADPTYKQVTRGGTGHYEAVQIIYDDARVTYAELIDKFLRSIDVTDAGGQFCDRGDSYRTAIFVSNSEEKAIAERVLSRAQRQLGKTIVTPILDAGPFYRAEEYHQDYYKGTNIVLTRRGPKRQDNAYKFYRDACGRDERVRELWGDTAPFAGT